MGERCRKQGRHGSKMTLADDTLVYVKWRVQSTGPSRARVHVFAPAPPIDSSRKAWKCCFPPPPDATCQSARGEGFRDCYGERFQKHRTRKLSYCLTPQADATARPPARRERELPRPLPREDPCKCCFSPPQADATARLPFCEAGALGPGGVRPHTLAPAPVPAQVSLPPFHAPAK